MIARNASFQIRFIDRHVNRSPAFKFYNRGVKSNV